MANVASVLTAQSSSVAPPDSVWLHDAALTVDLAEVREVKRLVLLERVTRLDQVVEY